MKAAVAAAFALSLGGAAQAVTLHMHNGGEVGSLDPSKVDGDWENRVVGDYIEGLMTEDQQANAILGQAASYKVSDDGKTYTFTLRDDAKWSDGVPVTADDFVLGFQRLLDPKAGNSYAYLQFTIKNAEAYNAGKVADFADVGVKALDEKTLQFTLENATPYFLQALTHYTAYPVPKHVIDKVGNDWVKLENIVANGPYKPTEWVPGSYIHSVKNPLYYDAANVKIDDVYYYVLEDQVAALNRYRAGEFDILTDFPADQYQWMEQNMPGQAHVKPFLGVYYYVMNQTRPELQDKRVREALSISINRDVIGPDVLGTGELPAYGWVPPGTANYEGDQYMPDWAKMSYEDRVAMAKKLMSEAGYTTDHPLKLQLKYNTNDNHQRIAVAISAMWKPIGVDVELFNSEVRVHYDALEQGDFQIGRAGWLMDYNDPQNMLQLLETGNGNNYGRYSNPEYDKLMAESDVTLDLTKRAGLMHQAEKIAMDDFAVIPIYYYVSKNVVSPKIHGFEDNAKDIHRTRWLTKDE
ncbi:MAG TPA: peptide ABC transporter substrate-binding protein [Devosiaceae bacterium]